MLHAGRTGCPAGLSRILTLSEKREKRSFLKLVQDIRSKHARRVDSSLYLFP